MFLQCIEASGGSRTLLPGGGGGGSMSKNGCKHASPMGVRGHVPAKQFLDSMSSEMVVVQSESVEVDSTQLVR